tara:strand:+ start:9820 stop:10833 length:1014 start_codon:yes stop_codon:yes gene_type:complete
MSAIAAAIGGGALAGGYFSSKGASKAAGASRDAADAQAQAQREQLDYLKEVEAIPQFHRENALNQLGMLYGTGAPPVAANDPAGTAAPLQGFNFQRGSGGLIGDFASQVQAQANQYQQSQLSPEIQQQLTARGGGGGASPQPQGKAGFIQGLLDDPFYKQLVERGEEGVLRNASVTGGLRSGNAQDALARTNQDALFNVYNEQVSGLQGLAGLPSNANNIAGVIGGIGATQAGGILGAGRAQQAGYQGISDSIGTAVGLGLQYDAFSDGRLKKDIEYVGTKNGHAWYKWTWNQIGEQLGLSGASEGVMADKVEKYLPEAIGERNGFKTVNYPMLGVA